MTEAHSGEVEKVLLYVGDARDRARAAAEGVARDGAHEHVVQALRETERALGELHTRLTQQTFYAIPDRNSNSSSRLPPGMPVTGFAIADGGHPYSPF